MKRFCIFLFAVSLLAGCSPKAEPAPPNSAPPAAGTTGTTAPASSGNGGAVFGPDGKPMTGIGR